MSEEQEYPMRVRVQMAGFDTVRYAVVEADSLLDVRVRMAGFNLFLHGLFDDTPKLVVEMKEGESAVAVSDLNEPLRRCIMGATQVITRTDSLRVRIAERRSKVYQPRLKDVDFSFTEQYGLCGEPVIRPANVVLYGPEEALDKIDELCVAATSIPNVNESATYRLPLEPVWERYPDVYPSVREVEVYVPVEPYVEHQYRVPIAVSGADTTVSLRLYPEEAVVRVWVPQRDIGREPDLKVSVEYAEILQSGGVVSPRLTEFPSYVRPRSVEPHEVQCVIIK